MRLILPPQKSTGPTRKRSGGTGGNYREPRTGSVWKDEWIREKATFVQLECGHKLNVNVPGVLVFHRNRKTLVLCDECDKVALVVRTIGLLEFADIPRQPQSEDPPF